MSQHERAPARPLYDEVERIRLRNGWTKVQLARNAGVGRNTIENWKTQPRAPLAPTVKDVAERLGMSPDMALRLAGIIPLDEPTPRERLVDAMQARLADLGLAWESAIPPRLDVTQYSVETLTHRDKQHLEELLRWEPGGVDAALAGDKPSPLVDRAVSLGDSAHASDEVTTGASEDFRGAVEALRQEIATLREETAELRDQVKALKAESSSETPDATDEPGIDHG